VRVCVCRGLLVQNDSVRRAFQIIKLTGTDRPQKCPHDHGRHEDSQRYQQVKDFHVSAYCDHVVWRKLSGA